MDSLDNVRTRLETLEQQTQQLQQHRTIERRLRWWRGIACGVVVLGLLSLAHPSQAADFSCAAGDVACLIAAITMANANGEANTIQLAAGTYTLTSSFDPFAEGLPTITSSLTIRGASPGTTTVIERDPAGPPFRLLRVATSGNLTLANLTLQHGGPGEPLSLGGAVINSGILTVEDSIITTNVASLGGGIFTEGTLTVLRSTIRGNRGSQAGGGLWLSSGSALVAESIFIANSAGVNAGAIEAEQGQLLVVNSTIAGNDAALRGGGIDMHFQSFATVINSTIFDNNNVGITVLGDPFDRASGATLINTVLAGNHGGPVRRCNPRLPPDECTGDELPRATDCSGNVTSLGHNLIGDPTGCRVTLAGPGPRPPF